MSKQDITVIVLTFNEEIHIERCLNNAKRFAKDIFVVDSFSTDNTCRIAEKMGARVYKHAFVNHATQFQWALENLPISTEWVWKQDADEYLSDKLIDEINYVLSQTPSCVNAYTAECLRIFMGKWIKHGIVPLVLLRLFKYKYGRIENKSMDEHLYITEGKIGCLKHPFYDDNLNSLEWWTSKHNKYSTKESYELLLTEYGIYQDNLVVNSGAHSESVRRMKLRYTKLPLFFRCFLYFVYRYIFRLGFLDGKEGFLWHFLQGFWYRILADAKVYEVKK
ncbi:MAG: glycosyltransferase family 2 protein, partial [Prevotella sp.]|nr:glycosyltransferase family 2 protein [Prevotella sp.]